MGKSNYKTVCVDVDKTLVFDTMSKHYDPERSLLLTYVNGAVSITPHTKNIELVKLFYKLGYEVIVWSKTGSDWAEAVCTEVGLRPYVSTYLTKPMYYIDDEECSKWMGQRRWLKPEGEED